MSKLRFKIHFLLFFNKKTTQCQKWFLILQYQKKFWRSEDKLSQKIFYFISSTGILFLCTHQMIPPWFWKSSHPIVHTFVQYFLRRALSQDMSIWIFFSGLWAVLLLTIFVHVHIGLFYIPLFCPLVHFSADCVTRLTRAGGSANAAASLASSPPTMSRFADDSGGIEIIADNDGGGIAYGREATKFAHRFFLLPFLIIPRATGLSAFYTFTLLYNVFSRSVQNNSRYHYYCVADPDVPLLLCCGSRFAGSEYFAKDPYPW